MRRIVTNDSRAEPMGTRARRLPERPHDPLTAIGDLEESTVWTTLLQVCLDLRAGVAAAPRLCGESDSDRERADRHHRVGLTNPATAREIEGYASLTSVNRGGQIQFFVNTGESSYRLEIFRLGWYGGAGGRRLTSAVTRTGRRQVTPAPDPVTGLVDCNWVDPYTVTVPAAADPSSWASGVYVVKLTAGTSGKQSYIIFVVRDDLRPSDVLFQSSVTTFQAYNNWGGESLYAFNSVVGTARKVSFNRPYGMSLNPAAAAGVGAGRIPHRRRSTRATGTVYPTGWEVSMVRWLERKGYDVSYATDLDTHRDANLLLAHKAFLSVGHDEYWTAPDAGPYRSGAAGRGPPRILRRRHRLLADPPGGQCDHGRAGSDDRGVQEHGAHGGSVRARQRSVEQCPDYDPLPGPAGESAGRHAGGGPLLANPFDAEVVVTNASHWVYGGTGLANGAHLPQLIGFEADALAGSAPPGTVLLAHSPVGGGQAADMTIYSVASGATVFAAGTIQWSWGLDDYGVPSQRPTRLSAAAERMTQNVLGRFLGTLPATRPAKPSGLTASGGDGRVTLTWPANREADLAGYSLFRGTTTNVPTIGLPLNGTALITGTSFVDATVTNSVNYYYTLVAIDREGDASPASDIVLGAPPAVGFTNGSFELDYTGWTATGNQVVVGAVSIYTTTTASRPSGSTRAIPPPTGCCPRVSPRRSARRMC